VDRRDEAVEASGEPDPAPEEPSDERVSAPQEAPIEAASPEDVTTAEPAPDEAPDDGAGDTADADPDRDWREVALAGWTAREIGVQEHRDSAESTPLLAASRFAEDSDGRPAATPRRSPFRRRRIWPAIGVGAVAVGILVATLGSGPGLRPIASPSGSPAASSAGEEPASFGQVDEIRQRAADAARGIEPMAVAADDLVSWAATAVRVRAHPVQPLVVDGNDNPLVDDATRVYGLGLAYVATGDETFADAAAKTIRSWVDTVQWADDTCTDSGGCHTTLSISRAAPGFVFGADLIAGSTAWSSDDVTAFQSWLRSVILPAASERPNNWGDAGTFMRAAVTDYLGDEAGFSAAIAKWRSGLDLIEASGRIPEESRRGTAGISYTQEALQYKIAVAQIADRRGIDLWDAVGAKGGTLKIALDRLAYYFSHPAEWPDSPDAEVPVPGPAWELAYAHWRDPAWAPIVLAVRPYGDRGHSAIRWTTFTDGVPIDPITAGASPIVPSSAAPSPSVDAPDPSSAAPEPTSTPAAPAPGALKELRVRLVPSAASGDVAVRVSWSAPSGADTVRLETSTDGSWHRLVESERLEGSFTDARRPGTVSYRGRITQDGVAGPWLELGGVVTDRIDASGKTLALRGSWSMAGGSHYSSGTVLSTDRTGATATWDGTARDLVIIGPIGPTRGEMQVLVDGKLIDTIQLHASSYVARQVLATLHWSTPGAHTVVIRASSADGRTVAVDELVRLDGGALSSPASTP
jgi:hypothetical protein